MPVKNFVLEMVFFAHRIDEALNNKDNIKLQALKNGRRLKVLGE